MLNYWKKKGIEKKEYRGRYKNFFSKYLTIICTKKMQQYRNNYK